MDNSNDFGKVPSYSAAMTSLLFSPALLPAVHNSLILLLAGVLLVWFGVSVSRLLQQGKLLKTLRSQEALQLDGMGSFTEDFTSIFRSHFNQILRMKANVAPIGIMRIELPTWIQPETIKLVPRGTSSQSTEIASRQYRLTFDVDSSAPCSVRIFWGVDVQSLERFIHRNSQFLVSQRIQKEMCRSTSARRDPSPTSRSSSFFLSSLWQRTMDMFPTASVLPPTHFSTPSSRPALTTASSRRHNPPLYIRRAFDASLNAQGERSDATRSLLESSHEVELTLNNYNSPPSQTVPPRQQVPLLRPPPTSSVSPSTSPPAPLQQRIDALVAGNPLPLPVGDRQSFLSDVIDFDRPGPLASLISAPSDDSVPLQPQGSSDPISTEGEPYSEGGMVSLRLLHFVELAIQNMRDALQGILGGAQDAHTSSVSSFGVSRWEVSPATTSAPRIPLVLHIRQVPPLAAASCLEEEPEDNLVKTVTAEDVFVLARLKNTMTVEVVQQVVVSSAGIHEPFDIFGLEDRNERDCLICMTNPKNTVLLPCRHCSSCDECLRSLRQERCPICRSGFSGFITFPFLRTGSTSNASGAAGNTSPRRSADDQMNTGDGTSISSSGFRPTPLSPPSQSGRVPPRTVVRKPQKPPMATGPSAIREEEEENT